MAMRSTSRLARISMGHEGLSPISSSTFNRVNHLQRFWGICVFPQDFKASFRTRVGTEGVEGVGLWALRPRPVTRAGPRARADLGLSLQHGSG